MSDIARSIREREQAFEALYKLDEELNFKIRARRDRIFGEWVAEKIGLQNSAATNYAIHAAQLNLEEAGDQNLLIKVTTDLKKAGQWISDDELHSILMSAYSQAQHSFQNEFPDALDRDHHV